MLKKVLLYVYGLLLLISLLIYKSSYLNVIFWIVLTLALVLICGYKKDNHYLKTFTIKIIIIALLSYLIITFGLGVIIGFNRSIFNRSFIGILSNISPIVVMLLCQEIIRYIYANASKNRGLFVYIFITFILFGLDVILQFNSTTFRTGESVFLFITATFLPKLFLHLLCSYITYYISYIPGFILRLVFGVYIFVLPIIPNLGNYLSSIIGVIFPFIIYKQVNDSINKYNQTNYYILKLKNRYIYIPLMILLFILILLISGIGRYHLVAIGSGSMEPVIYRGDAVLIDQNVSIEEYKIGDVLAFKYGNVLITHRIVGFSIVKDKYIFKTKGDNNETVDDFIVSQKDVKGKVIFNVKYIGLPTVVINEYLKK